MAKKTIKQGQSRDQLMEYFRNGNIPNETHYAELIQSMVHKNDDGFSKDQDNGLKIYNEKSHKNLVSFYTDLNDIEPFYQISKDEMNPTCLRFRSGASASETDDKREAKSFYFHENGNLGLGTKPNSRYKLDAKGFVGMNGRIGTLLQGFKPADGKWHTLISGLDNCQAYEVVARAGKKGTGRFSMMHAIALSAYGGNGGRIRKTSTCFGFFWNKLNLRWRGTTHDYALQIKTNINYGAEAQLFFTITKLWDDGLFLSEADYY